MHNDLIAACRGLEKELEDVKKELAKTYPGLDDDPVHVDLYLASAQSRIFEKLLDPTESGDDPLVRVVAPHYFTYDRSRITNVISRPAWLEKHLGLEPNFLSNPSEQKPQQGKLSQVESYNQLVMFAYRQIFQERRTLNAWLLRMGELPISEEQAKFELRRTVSTPPSEELNSWSVFIPDELARRMAPESFIAEFRNIVLSNWLHYRSAREANDRFERASDLYDSIRRSVKEGELQPPSYQDFIKDDQSKDDYEEAERRVRILLHLPSSNAEHIREEVARNIFTMLQSAVFYMLFYDAMGFYSLTTEKAKVPFGVTVLTKRALTESELKELGVAVSAVAKAQREYVRKLLEKFEGRSSGKNKRVHLPEDVSLTRFDLKILKSKLGEKFWNRIIKETRIPAHALAAFIKVVERASESEIEHQFPRTAFVLGQSSYLESVGFISIKFPPPKVTRSSYLELVDDCSDESLCEMARHYELDRWETGTGILPYDIVSRLSSAEDGRDEPTELKHYLMDKWGYPEPSEGFHLLDLDPRFVYPALGVSCLRRLETGVIGWFQEGGPPAGGLGYKPYLNLSEGIVRLVAGVTDGVGNAVLISGGHVQAVYRRREWEFYDRDTAVSEITSLSQKYLNKDYTAPDDKALVCKLLAVAERLSHTYRKGAIFVLTDLTVEEWRTDNSARSRYFIPMIGLEDPTAKESYKVDKIEHLASIAQVDGCCVISKEDDVLGYGYKIAVSPEQVFKEEWSDPVRLKQLQADFRKDIVQPGTRRWSSALLSKATRWRVLNVSSDGPVTLFLLGKPYTIYPTPLQREKRWEARK